MLFEQKTDVPCSLCGWLHFFYASISHEVALYVINMEFIRGNREKGKMDIGWTGRGANGQFQKQRGPGH